MIAGSNSSISISEEYTSIQGRKQFVLKKKRGYRVCSGGYAATDTS
jgi:hypothetical protein